MAGKEKMAVEGEGKLKPVKVAWKPLQSLYSTSRLIDLMQDENFLLQTVLSFYNSDHDVFVVRGKELHFLQEHVSAILGLSSRGVLATTGFEGFINSIPTFSSVPPFLSSSTMTYASVKIEEKETVQRPSVGGEVHRFPNQSSPVETKARDHLLVVEIVVVVRVMVVAGPSGVKRRISSHSITSSNSSCSCSGGERGIEKLGFGDRWFCGTGWEAALVAAAAAAAMGGGGCPAVEAGGGLWR
ncbi:hypothetical protein QJS04_geneDACA006993 [Acorus gramineus]|uniref:Uncharacterized protein n=1 Tax=Acorus gramineus TaxID=55184 RepID=A0AAV9A2L9_ACOGR|nr:hypothetical protein QJS04_geneDACA006993 [Acorus gramineus]